MKVSQLLTISPVGQKCGGSMINSNVDLGCSNNDNNSSNYGGIGGADKP